LELPLKKRKMVEISFYPIPIFGRALFVERRHSLPLCTSGNYCVDSDEYDVLVE
jgi:hypothetical protein